MKKSVMGMAAFLSLAMAAPSLAAAPGQREARQQARVEQGLRSGQLNGREAARVEKKEAKVNAEIRADRAENGGKLTPAERAKVQRQQNRMSREIYRQKHDGQTQVGVAPAPRK
jgi:hypothetical protein